MRLKRFLNEMTIELVKKEKESFYRTWSLNNFISLVKKYSIGNLKKEGQYLSAVDDKFIFALMDQRSLFNGQGAIAPSSKETTISGFIKKYFKG